MHTAYTNTHRYTYPYNVSTRSIHTHVHAHACTHTADTANSRCHAAPFAINSSPSFPHTHTHTTPRHELHDSVGTAGAVPRPGEGSMPGPSTPCRLTPTARPETPASPKVTTASCFPCGKWSSKRDSHWAVRAARGCAWSGAAGGGPGAAEGGAGTRVSNADGSRQRGPPEASGARSDNAASPASAIPPGLQGLLRVRLTIVQVYSRWSYTPNNRTCSPTNG